MKGDFSRVSFDPRNHFSQVFLQQGRVTLDADPNEQGAILLHVLRTMARDLFGPYGGPVDNMGFTLSLPTPGTGEAQRLAISPGRYYVDGILCENDGCDYAHQPHFMPAPPDGKGGGDPLRTWLEQRGSMEDKYWLYLDVWERHVTSIEQPSLREVALGGPDTCSRAQVVWQVKALEFDAIVEALKMRHEVFIKRAQDTRYSAEDRARYAEWVKRIESDLRLLESGKGNACAVPLDALHRFDLPEMAARIDPADRLDDPCITSPESGYRGAENHLYRVEIHRGNGDGARPTFKWSRDNGSVLATWVATEGSRVVVGNTRGFAPGAWVELTCDEHDLHGRSGELFRIVSIDGDALVVDGTPGWTGKPGSKARRWDQAERGDIALLDGAVPVPVASATDPGWIALEDGISIRFAPERRYQAGDYWLITARVATGGIDWPLDVNGQAQLLPPRGVEHHYAPLGGISRNANGAFEVTSCQCTVHAMNTCTLGTRGEVFAARPNSDAIVNKPITPPPAPPAPPVATPTPTPTPAGGEVVVKPVVRKPKKPVA